MENVKKRSIVLGMIIALFIVEVGMAGLGKQSVLAADKLKSACAATVKATGNVKKLTYKTSTPSDFDAISFRHDKKVSAMYYVTSDNTVYNVCVVRAKSAAYAKTLYSAFAEYKKARLENEYFKTDYTKTEQNIMRNAIYGRQGKYVWYISMSSKKKNLAGQTALKKKL